MEKNNIGIDIRNKKLSKIVFIEVRKEFTKDGKTKRKTKN